MKTKQGGLTFLIKIAYRNIYRNLRRSILCVIAVSLAVLVIIFALSFIYGMIDSVSKISQVFETGHIRIYAKEFDDKKEFFPLQYPVETAEVSLDDFVHKLEAMEGIERVFPRIRSVITLTDNVVKHAYLWGFDLDKEFQYHHFNFIKKDNGLLEGRYPAPGANECAIGKRLADKLGVSTGMRLDFKILSSQFSDKFASPLITGMFDFDYLKVDQNYILMDLKRVQKLVVLNDKTQSLFLYVNEIKDIPRLTKSIQKELKDKNLTVKNWMEDNFYFSYILNVGLKIYNLIFAVFVIVASFLIVNTIIMVIYERMKEIGMMGALGLKRKEIVLVFFLEAVFLSFFGSLFGALAGTILTAFLSKTPISYESMTGGVEIAVNNTIFVIFSIKYIVGGFLYGLVLSSLCTILPSLKAAFIEPVEALRR